MSSPTARTAALPDRDEAHHLSERALALSEADETEIVLMGTDARVTRFAQNQIHQNVSTRDLEIRVRAVFGRRVGVATTNDPSDEGLRRVVRRACEVARVQPESTEFRGLPVGGLAPGAPCAYISRTADYTPAQRAAVVSAICSQAESNGLVASGAFETGAQSLSVANSHGIFGHHVGTRAALLSVVMGDDSSGYTSRLDMDADAIDGEAAGHEAIATAVRGRGPVDVEPGPWTVVLEEYAVADMLAYLAFIGLGAMNYQQGASFASGRLGEQVSAPSVTIWDDGLDARGVVNPFDYEGVPRQNVSLIDRGIARNVVYDSFTANRESRASTGHALPAPNPFGPFPCNMFMAGGQATREGLLEGVARGLWVTRFHYVNVMDPKATVITGMTRNGTFLIESGQLTRPVKNLRFTEEILGALSRVTEVSRETRLLPAWFGAIRCPAIRIDGFNFSGKTAF